MNKKDISIKKRGFIIIMILLFNTRLYMQGGLMADLVFGIHTIVALLLTWIFVWGTFEP